MAGVKGYAVLHAEVVVAPTITQWPDQHGTGGNDAERTAAIDVGT